MFIVLELQKQSESKSSNLTWNFEKENDAWSKYHAVLSAAAISDVPTHAAYLLNETGLVANSWFYHSEEEENE